MRRTLATLAIASMALAATPSSGSTLLVEWTESGAGIDASWNEDSNPVPDGYNSLGAVVSIWNFASTGSTSVGPYSFIIWYNADNYGLFDTPNSFYSLYGDQAYTGPESAPVFETGVYQGTDYTTGAAATVTISSVPEASTWALMVLGFSGLGIAGWRARRTAAAGT